MCRRGKTAADVGCDHAQLACWLALNVSSLVIASDVRDGPLDAAQRTVAECGVTNVEIVKSDGLARIDFADDVIICGMGGELIAKIISGCRFLSEDTRFILQPMTKDDHLRRWLYQNGFEIENEIIAAEQTADKVRRYIIMYVRYTGVCLDVDEYFAYTGKITDKEYLNRLGAKLQKIAGHTTDEKKSGDLQRIALKIFNKIKGM